MPVTVIVGGQFGSEGKGKVAHYLAREQRATIAVRVGGSNSGHTAIDRSGVPRIFRVLPTPALLDDVICVLGAGTYIDIDVLLAEMKVARLPPERLLIDPNAYVITDDHKRIENQWGLRERIGSTGSGTGGAAVERIMRQSSADLARHNPRLNPYTSRSPRSLFREALNRKERVIIEGTQGYGLSVLHSPYYPKATSRDTTAAAFISEAGLSPLDVDEVVLVIRAFPIRVPGDSGYLPREINWDTVAAESGWPFGFAERTSVTDQIRRVARFDPMVVNAAIEANLPTQIVLNHADYFDYEGHRSCKITDRMRYHICQIDFEVNYKLSLVGIGQNLLIPWKRHGLVEQKSDS
jgi:adenylosuccinate synthase